MRPNTSHMVATVSELGSNDTGSLCSGGHFYSNRNLARTLLGRWRDALWNRFITNATHPEGEAQLQRMYMYYDLLEKLDQDQGCTLPIDPLSLAALTLMCVCPSIFIPSPHATPDFNAENTFQAQRRNVSLLAAERLKKWSAEGGLMWECWVQLVEEMEDLVSRKDDILLPMRHLVTQASKGKGEKSSAFVLYPHFAKRLEQFYSPPYSTRIGKGALHRHWSNLANGTATFDETNGKATYPDRVGSINTHATYPMQARGQSTGEFPAGEDASWSVELQAKLADHLEGLQKGDGPFQPDADNLCIGFPKEWV